ncbi:MAG: hypothetical protein ISS72_04335 [Candidatus Brocadiae bacterium]|nr:hypothetical protein [Candidatus Brocadiia bacterium]
MVPSHAAGLDDFHWREDFATAERFAPRPTWLSNASTTAAVASDGRIATFRVDEPRQGMKWSATMPSVALDETPWLVLRYHADNLLATSDDYLIYLDDDVRDRQLNAIRLKDAVADGQWHTVAVDVTTLTNAPGVHTLAVQVQSTAKGGARLLLDWLTFAAEPPAGATLIRRTQEAPLRPDWVAPLAQATWTPHTGWLSNPAAKGKHAVALAPLPPQGGKGWRFRIAEAGRGMKWSWSLPKPAPLEGHRYVAMRYRATGLRPAGDYALCVLGSRVPDGHDYASIIPSAALISDGRWHTATVDIRQAARDFPSITALAVQAQAATTNATLEVADLRFVNAIQPSRLADFIDWQPGAKFDGTQPIPIQGNASSAPWRKHLRLADWFPQAEITAHGIPFRLTVPQVGNLREGSGLAATGLRAKEELRFPASVKASEVYLLLLGAFVGTEEPVYGSGKFKAIRDVDRFRLRLEYADGTADECLPMNAATKQFGITPGPQVLVAAADPAKTLKSIVLRDLCKQAAFAVAAATARAAGRRAFPEAVEDGLPLRPKRFVREGDPFKYELGTEMSGQPGLRGLVHNPTGWNYLERPCALMELHVDGKQVIAESYKRYAVRDVYEGGKRLWGWGEWAYHVTSAPGLDVEFIFGWWGHDKWAERHPYIRVSAINNGTVERRVRFIAPRIGPYWLTEQADNAYYLIPKRGAAFDNRPCSYRERYCGLFPVQFLSTFSPKDGRGLSLHTMDRTSVRKRYLLQKKGAHFTMGVEYPECLLKPGEKTQTAPTIIIATDGDWHEGFQVYRKWLKASHKPLSPRKPWFREVFSFRQRFLHAHDPMYDYRTGQYRLLEAIAEDTQEFGGVDYLHIFDWGNRPPYGRVYGRTGDHSPYDYLKGGREAFREAIAGVQKQGIPTGLYIEGYLLSKLGKLGQAHGKGWQIIRPDGKGLWWAGEQEMMVCPGVEAWREVQASTYETKVKELGVDGMYIDQFGFTNSWKDCYSKQHGHPVPSYPVVTERDMTKLIRERVEAAKKGVAIYTEETPVDVTTPFQDGSFTYAMNAARRTQTLVPINIARFAFPAFKTIEILYCDKPTGSWATGVRWVFFNGEALWIEGPPEWFEPETRAEIRRCYRILRKHKDAFTSLQPVPLVPTEMGGVWANEFTSEVIGRVKVVYTLYNARHRTVRGDVLRVPHEKGATYQDEWHQKPAAVRIEGKTALLSTALGPHGTGCLVVMKR